MDKETIISNCEIIREHETGKGKIINTKIYVNLGDLLSLMDKYSTQKDSVS